MRNVKKRQKKAKKVKKDYKRLNTQTPPWNVPVE